MFNILVVVCLQMSDILVVELMATSVFMYLLGAYKVNLTPRESVIIFDEVQRFPRAREAIKYLVKDGRYDYIETGSLISIQREPHGDRLRCLQIEPAASA